MASEAANTPNPTTPNRPIGVGVIGYGYWGPNLVRNFAELPGVRVVAVCDRVAERLAPVRMRYPAVRTTADAQELFDDPAIDAIVVATPLSTHFELGMRALKAGKHVLIEKPMAANSAQGEALIQAAEENRRVLMVDHTFVYAGAVGKIKQLLDDGHLGKPYYYDSVRVNLGLFQHDINVLWDLAVHDLAILDYLVGVEPRAVSATAMAHVPGGPEDIAYLTCLFEDNLIAHFHVNWLAPVKIRRTLIGGDSQMIVYDDLEADEKVKVYNKGIQLKNEAGEPVYQQLVNYRTGDMMAPNLDRTEALHREAEHFIDCIINGRTPITDGRCGLRIVRILEAADRSLKALGAQVDVIKQQKPARAPKTAATLST